MNGAFDEDLTGSRFKMLVQQPDTESLPRIGGDEVLAKLVKAGAVVLAQLTDIGGVHVAQSGVVLNAVVPHRQHRYLLVKCCQRALRGLQPSSDKLTERDVDH